MHELKTGLNTNTICYFLNVSEKFLSLIRFVNDPHTLYNRLNASRLARFRKTRKHVNQQC